MKKNIKWIALLLIIIVVGITSVIIIKRKNSRGITRNEWIQMLTDEFKLKEYEQSDPYYEDVNRDDPYFAAIQAAHEWGITDGEEFEGKKRITGEYAAITVLKAVGPHRIKIYMGLSELPTDSDYITLAVNEGLIADRDLRAGITQEMGQDIIAKAMTFGLENLWIDDYADVEYSDKVIEINDESVISYTPEENSLKISDISGIEKGSVIVFYNEYTGFKNAGKVSDITGNTVIIEEVELSEVINHLVISDIIPMSAVDIQRALQQSDNGESRIQTMDWGSIHLPIDKEVVSSGVKVDVSITSDGDASISFTDNETGISQSVGFSGIAIKESSLDALDKDSAVGGNVYFESSFNLSKFNIGLNADIEKNLITGDLSVNSLVAQTETEIDVITKSGCNLEAKIPVIKGLSIVGNEYLAGISLDIYMVISLDGSISFEADFPAYAVFEYRNGAYPRFDSGAECNLNDVNLNCTLEDKIRLQPNIVILGMNIFDMEVDFGAGASADVKVRKKSNILFCADIDFYAPILSIGCNDGGSLSESIIPSMSLDILTSDNAPFKEKYHYERYRDHTGKLVDKCTFNESEQGGLDLSMPHIYYGEFNGPFSKVDGHYEAEGKVYSEALAMREDVDKLAIGKSFECDGVTFTVTEMGERPGYDFDDSGNIVEGTDKWYILDDKYIVSTGEGGQMTSNITGESVEYCNIKLVDPDSRKPVIRGNEELYEPDGKEQVYILIDDEYTFKTLDIVEPYFIPIDVGKWYILNYSTGSTGAHNDEKERLAGADIVPGVEKNVYIMK